MKWQFRQSCERDHLGCENGRIGCETGEMTFLTNIIIIHNAYGPVSSWLNWHRPNSIRIFTQAITCS